MEAAALLESSRTLDELESYTKPTRGSGGMAHAYLPAFCAVRKISQGKVYSPTQAPRETFAKEMSRELGIPVEPFDDPEPVVRGSGIVTTCTDSNKLDVTDPTWIEKGMHLANCSSKEFSFDIVKRCDIAAQVGTETFGAKRYLWNITE